MDGILNIGPSNMTGTGDEYSPNFVLMGWDEGIIPTNNWTDGFDHERLSKLYSTDVRLLLSRWTGIFDGWSDTGSRPYDLGWSVDTGPGAQPGSFDINGTWRGVGIPEPGRREQPKPDSL